MSRVFSPLRAVAFAAVTVGFVFTSSANAATTRVLAAITPPAAPMSEKASVAPKSRKSGANVAKSYFVEFRARAAASYGHMYVLYGELNGRNEIVKSDIAGLHPAGDARDCGNCSLLNWMIGHVVFVPSETGASDGDLEERYVTARYRVMLDRAQYEHVRDFIKRFQANPPQWHALWRNCVSFGREVAEFIGLRTPGFLWLEPKQFVEGLQDLNGGGKDQEPLVDAAQVTR